jgi:hypothetical protein
LAGVLAKASAAVTSGSVILESENVASVTSGGAGVYTIAFTTTFANTNYRVHLTAFGVPFNGSVTAKAVGSCTINLYATGTGVLTNGAFDITFFGRQ